MRIGINFSDNDFRPVLREFGNFLLSAVSVQPKLIQELTKEHIIELFNNMGYALYRAYQNCWQYNKENSVDIIQKYLQIKNNQVFLNQEIDNLIIQQSKHYFDGGFLYIDCDNLQIEIW
jgi:hypothetical protein